MSKTDNLVEPIKDTVADLDHLDTLLQAAGHRALEPNRATVRDAAALLRQAAERIEALETERDGLRDLVGRHADRLLEQYERAEAAEAKSLRLEELKDFLANDRAYLNAVLSLVDSAFQTGAGQRKRIAALKEVRKALAPADDRDQEERHTDERPDYSAKTSLLNPTGGKGSE